MIPSRTEGGGTCEQGRKDKSNDTHASSPLFFSGRNENQR